jgi:hypothetical protein
VGGDEADSRALQRSLPVRPRRLAADGQDQHGSENQRARKCRPSDHGE